MLIYLDPKPQSTHSYDFDVASHHDIYHTLVDIDNDRYRGAYSGFPFTAWLGPRPDDISDPDPICLEFWEKWAAIALFGGGETPQEAFEDLIAKCNTLGLYVTDDANPKDAPLLFVRVDYGTDGRGKGQVVPMVYNSDEFRKWRSS